MLSDVSDAMERADNRVSQLPSPSGDHSKSRTNPIALDVKSLRLLNTQQPSDIRLRLTPGNTVWKTKAQFDDYNSDRPKSKRRYLSYIARKVWESRRRGRRSRRWYDGQRYGSARLTLMISLRLA